MQKLESNSKMGDYTVYRHIFPNGKVYIGITRQQNLNRRWNNGQGYKSQTLMAKAVNKYGWNNVNHEVMAVGLSKTEAESMEIALISEHHSNNPQYGYNIDNGGNCAGTHSEETKRKIGNAQRGALNHNYGKPSVLKGKKMSAEAIEINRLSHLGQVPYNKGKPMSEEQKAKLRKPKTEEHKRKISEAKAYPVVCVETGQCFKSGTAAGLQLGINRGSISRAIREHIKAGGYHWKYA